MGSHATPAALLTAALALVLTAAPARSAAPQDGDGKLKIAVVDLKTCFDRTKYERIKEVDDELTGVADQLSRKLKELDQELKILKEQLSVLDPAKQPGLTHEKQLRLLQVEAELKYRRDAGRRHYLEYYSERKIEVYNEIRRGVAEVAKAGGYTLVLRVEGPLLDEENERTGRRNVTQLINNRVVLYHNDAVDITEKVLAWLNAEYAKQKASGWTCPVCRKTNKGETCTATPGCTGKKP